EDVAGDDAGGLSRRPARPPDPAPGRLRCAAHPAGGFCRGRAREPAPRGECPGAGPRRLSDPCGGAQGAAVYPHGRPGLCHGCDAGRLARQSVLEIVAMREALTSEEDAPRAGTLRSTPVDLFARRALRWVQTRQGAWVLSLGAPHGTLRLRPDGPDTWQVVQVRRDTEPVRLGDTLPLPYAQGLAEDYARHLGVARLVEAEAPWR